MKSFFLVLAVTVAIPLFSEASPQGTEEDCLRRCGEQAYSRTTQPYSSHRRNEYLASASLSSCKSRCRIFSILKDQKGDKKDDTAQSTDDVAGYINQNPSPIFKLSLGGTVSRQNSSVSSWRDGFATENSQCISATAGGFVHAKYRIRRRAVSSAKIQTHALRLARHIKESYQKEFKESITNSAHGHESIWKWLGIGSQGSTSTKESSYYTEGQKGLNEARKEYREALSNNLESHVEIRSEALVEGLGPIATKACIYFAVQQVKLGKNEKMNIVISDDSTWVTADEGTGEVVANKNLKGDVIDL